MGRLSYGPRRAREFEHSFRTQHDAGTGDERGVTRPSDRHLIGRPREDAAESSLPRHQQIVIKSSADWQPRRCYIEMIKRTLGFVATVSVAAGLLQAHHSLAGVYDMKAEKELQGEVAQIKFSNPHGSLSLDVKNADGSNTEWVLTLGSATALAQRGIGKTGPNALHQGDKITVKFLPAKDGSPLGFLKTVIMPDGRVIQISAGNPND
jgi:Family of unknown function (DUF6152)